MPRPVFKIASRPLDTSLRLKRHYLPPLEIKLSCLEGAGLGLFSTELIEKGSLITEYGGRIVYRTEAEQMRLRGEDTHLRAVVLGSEALDGRVQEPLFSQDYYIKNHLAGGFANGAPKSSDRNTVYINERGIGRIHPSGEVASDRVFLKAQRDIQPGEEILVDYGPTFRRLHIKKS